MSILEVASQPEEVGVDVSARTTNATGRDAAYSPNSIAVLEGQQMNLPIRAYTGDFWLHFRLWTNVMATAFTANVPSLVAFFDAAGNELCRLTKTAGGATWRVRVFGDTTVTDAGAGISLATTTTYTFDIKVVVDASNITMELYSNGTLVSSATAANTVGGKGIPRLVVWPHSQAFAVNDSRYSEIIAANESTIGARLSVRAPNAAGAYSEWSGGAAELADTDLNTVASADADGERVSFSLTSYGGAASPASVRAVIAKSLSRRLSGTPDKLAHFLRIGGTDYEGTPETVPEAGFVQHVWDSNPAGGAWAVAALGSLEVGLKATT